jgi:hypothetical protein
MGTCHQNGAWNGLLISTKRMDGQSRWTKSMDNKERKRLNRLQTHILFQIYFKFAFRTFVFAPIFFFVNLKFKLVLIVQLSCVTYFAMVAEGVIPVWSKREYKRPLNFVPPLTSSAIYSTQHSDQFIFGNLPSSSQKRGKGELHNHKLNYFHLSSTLHTRTNYKLDDNSLTHSTFLHRHNSLLLHYRQLYGRQLNYMAQQTSSSHKAPTIVSRSKFNNRSTMSI